MQGKNTHSCAHCTKCACPHLLNIVTKKYFYVLRRMEIHFIFHKFSGSFFCERVYVCECVAFYHCRHNCRIHTLFFFGIIAISSTFVPTAVVVYCSHCCSYHCYQCWRHRDNISHCQIETLQLMSDYHKLLLLQVNYFSSELKHATKIYCIPYATWSAITKTYTRWTASKTVWHVNLLGIIFVVSRASSAAKL